MKPVRRPEVLFKDVGAERMLYSTEGKAIHTLNATAKLIWELCDGQHTPEQMAQTIRKKFSVPTGHDVNGDILETLRALSQKGLLQQSTLE